MGKPRLRGAEFNLIHPTGNQILVSGDQVDKTAMIGAVVVEEEEQAIPLFPLRLMELNFEGVDTVIATSIAIIITTMGQVIAGEAQTKEVAHLSRDRA